MKDVAPTRASVGHRLLGIIPSTVFVGPTGVRAGWRLLSFVAIWSLLDHLKNLVVWDHLLRYKDHPLWHPLDYVVWNGPEFAVTLVTAFLMMTLVERRRWPYSAYGLGLQAKSVPLFLEGLIWGFVTPTILILFLYFGRRVAFDGLALSGTLLVRFAAFWFVAILLGGLHDQFLFRGYPLFTVATGMGFWPAAILLSATFGGVGQYLFTRTATVVQLLSATLLSLFYSLSFRRTGSLWFAVGFQTMFEFTGLVLYGVPNIGNKGQSVTGHLLNLRFHGPAWITGGQDGLEASILFLLVLGVLFLILDRLHKEAVCMQPQGKGPAVAA